MEKLNEKVKVLWPLQKRWASEVRARSTHRWRLPEKRSWYDDDGFDDGFDKDFDDGDNNNSNETCL